MSSISASILKAIDSPDYVLRVEMPLFSKARPRLTRNGLAYMPSAYREAQAEMQRQLRAQWSNDPLKGPLALYLKLKGEARSDGDNVLGALLDAAGPSRGMPGLLWVDDRFSVIPFILVEWEKASKKDSCWDIQIAVL
jgi:Holliday junction resolvase RusA-like endonuclease